LPAPGTVWAADTWDADAWAADTWAGAGGGATLDAAVSFAAAGSAAAAATLVAAAAISLSGTATFTAGADVGEAVLPGLPFVPAALYVNSYSLARSRFHLSRVEGVHSC
jgi:hypothetical protein